MFPKIRSSSKNKQLHLPWPHNVANLEGRDTLGDKSLRHRAPVAQLVEHRAAMQGVVSSTPAGPTLRVLK